MSDLDDLEAMATDAGHPEPWRGAYGRRTSYCSAGHEYTPESTRWYKKANGQKRRICRACSRLHAGFKNIYKPRRAKCSPAM